MKCIATSVYIDLAGELMCWRGYTKGVPLGHNVASRPPTLPAPKTKLWAVDRICVGNAGGVTTQHAEDAPMTPSRNTKAKIATKGDQ